MVKTMGLGFYLVAYSLLFSTALCALLAWANYKANFRDKDGKTVINWNSKNEGKPEFVLLIGSMLLSLASFFIYILS